MKNQNHSPAKSVTLKKGFAVGIATSVTITVTKQMLATFEGESVHPFYSTFWLAYHAELAARRLVEPYLFKTQNGIGAELQVRHLAPSFEGETVTITATLAKISGNKIHCTITAQNQRGVIATGTQVQAILPKSKLTKLYKQTSHV
jgi:fluoroacetyl-CoA thioesterase